MAQTPQAEATVTSTGQTTPPAEGQPDFGIGNPTTILLLLFAVAIFWWSMRRRRAVEERMTAQRRAENIAAAEQSAREIAHIMRQAPPPGAAAAAASEGLASAARISEASIWPPLRESAPSGFATQAAPAPPEDTQLRTSERAEAAMEEGLLAAQRAEQTAGESVARRLAAAESAAAEVQADTVDALGTRHASKDEATRTASAHAAADADRGASVPPGAVAGDGTAICPPRFPVKGNVPSMIYHLPGQVLYPQTVPEFCFASAEAAESAGFRPSRAREERIPGA
jgi:large subunit ribosomal protein L17